MGVKMERWGIKEEKRNWAQQLGPKKTNTQGQKRKENKEKQAKGGRWDSNPGPLPSQTRAQPTD